MSIERIMLNLEYGNLTDAKKGAKRIPLYRLTNALVDYGMSYPLALITCGYLKDKITFQDYCTGKQVLNQHKGGE